MTPSRSLAAAVLFSTLLAAPFAHADLIPEPEDACHNAGDLCKLEGNKGACKNVYDERYKREVLACDLREKPSQIAPSTSAKEDVSKPSGCGVSDHDGSLGFGLGAVVGGVAVALLAVRRRRAR